jgi:GNAT superfamily N-acetyltransferase
MKADKLIRKISVRELRKSDWPSVVKLFGERGACGGCWCMHWRVPHGGKMWEAAVGKPNRRAFKKLIESGQAKGILAFDDKEPVGWCSFGKRLDFPRTETVKAYRRDDIGDVWSINCFYLAKGYRGIGLAHQMAEAALRAIRRRRGKLIEAYPTTLTLKGERLPATFSYTGPEAVFRRLGFKEIQRLAPTRPLYRLKLR